MRLTCRSQIANAIEISGIKETNSVALLGLVSSEIEVDNLVKTFLIKFEQANQDLELLAMNGEKAKKLKKIHGFSSALTRDQLLAALQERSVLLIFSK